VFAMLFGTLFCIVNLIIILNPSDLSDKAKGLYQLFFFIALIPTIISYGIFIYKWIQMRNKGVKIKFGEENTLFNK
jgi:hypothetical protein